MSVQTNKELTGLSRLVNEFEETAIAVILGAMTVITFINVILRYGFDTGIIWGLEMVSFLFAWLVLFGASYAVKTTSHLGVDAIVNLFGPGGRRALGLISGLICVVFAFLLLKGAWDYWANFANLPQTEGRWFPLGFEEMRRTSYRGWYEVIDIPMPEWLRWIEPIMNDGDEYEKIPRFIPYLILPVGMALLLFRFIQATVRIWQGKATSLIVSHEAEDDVESVRHVNAGD
ncbi:TRAP transporter small permease [Aliishimia ponticola]|uniref:TRAP transporter small permease protein n=1 Tax=Aliishimia ponticola TaxID=2499833 RepID=A0A4S4NKL6_9RHOB|nr:TRAP transporter small permease [Aliishimia ponticola]THH38821.1 TRAP transporter small permease [Aliishimia ponticola]